jgi:uncharacterized protein (TIGR03084 family)
MTSAGSTVLEEVLADLTAEGSYVESLVADLDEAGWRTPTPAEGWDIAMTISHLLWTDESSVKAVDGTLCLRGERDKEPWDALVMEAFADPAGFVDAAALTIAKTSRGTDLLTRWQGSRKAVVAKLRTVPEGQKLMWFGPPMSAASMATARLMETWAHGQDVADALISTGSMAGGYERTDRIRHVASIGVRTRNFAFGNNDLTPPAEKFRVELTLPSGATWTDGPEDAAQRVTGSAYDFCQLVTQRIHRADTDLVAEGVDAEQWLAIAQCFAGPAGGGRPAQNEGETA